MLELVKFTLKRRFINKTQILLFALTFVISGIVFFADKVVTFIEPDAFKDLTIYLSKELYQDVYLFEENKGGYILQEYKNNDLTNNEVKLSYINNEFVVISEYSLDTIDKAKIEYLISSYLENLYYKEANIEKPIEETIPISFKAINELDEDNKDKENVATLVLSAVYFTALSYSTAIATEVVSEKLSHVLDLVLTSVDPKEHYYSKIISGWLAIIIQSGFTFICALFWYGVRKAYDNTKGLMTIAKKIGLFASDAKTIKQFLKMINPDNELIVIIVSLFIFIVLGILLIQLILALIASNCTNIDESNGIQAIAYMLLMGIYYLSILLNNQVSLSEGLGKWLSFVPIINMLFMPSRIILNVVSWYEVLISIVMSLSSILLIVDFGSNIYESGILDYKEKNKESIIDKIVKYKERRKLSNSNQ